jgi:hypothetical protein
MRLQPNILTLDLKVQDRYRKWFSALGADPNYLASTCVILGDSDIDYELAPNIDNSRILSAPFSTEGIKHKLIYNGVGKNLSGVIKCFARKVLDDGSVESLYDYPVTQSFSAGTTPPTLTNGRNWEYVTFTSNQMGFILYFSTVLDFYLDANGVKKRLVENYDFTFDWNGSPLTPAGWNYIIDTDNGSIFLFKSAGAVGLTYSGKITAVGQSSQKVKELAFNF